MEVTLWVIVEMLTYEGAFMRSVNERVMVDGSMVSAFYETETACHDHLLKYAKPNYKIYKSQEVERLTVQYSLSQKHEAYMFCNPFFIDENAVEFLHVR